MADLIERDALLLKQKAHADLFADSTLHDDIVRRDEATSALAEIINAPAVNRWISVEDSLPGSKEDVLVWFEYFRYGEYNCLYQTYGIGNYNKNYDGWMVNHETGWDQLRVIAWMPMPDAYEQPEKE